MTDLDLDHLVNCATVESIMQYATLLFILTNDIVLFGVLGLRAGKKEI